jgi:hypothetical protein
MGESGLPPAPVRLDSRQPQFAVRIGNASHSKQKTLHQDSSSGTLICREFEREYKHGRTSEGISWPGLGNNPAVRTIILLYKTIAKRAAQCWTWGKGAKVGAGIYMCWTERLISDEDRLGAAAVCDRGTESSTCGSNLGM